MGTEPVPGHSASFPQTASLPPRPLSREPGQRPQPPGEAPHTGKHGPTTLLRTTVSFPQRPPTRLRNVDHPPPGRLQRPLRAQDTRARGSSHSARAGREAPRVGPAGAGGGATGGAWCDFGPTAGGTGCRATQARDPSGTRRAAQRLSFQNYSRHLKNSFSKLWKCCRKCEPQRTRKKRGTPNAQSHPQMHQLVKQCPANNEWRRPGARSVQHQVMISGS